MPVLLHVHSWYSLLEGVTGPAALLGQAAEEGWSALALTDTNNLYAATAYVAAAKQAGVRPLLGACLRQGRFRGVALIENPAGYSSLCRILGRLNLREWDPEQQASGSGLRDLVRDNANGLHFLTEEPEQAADLKEAFGDRLWLELIRPRKPDDRPGQSSPEEDRRVEEGKRLGSTPLASVPVHFGTAADYPVFRLTTAIRRGMLLEHLPRQLHITPAHHLPTLRSFRRLFADRPEALAATEELAQRLGDDVLPTQVVLPPAKLPRTLDEVAYLRLLCERGLKSRGLPREGTYRDRLQEELAIIEAGGLSGYFLVVRDIARYARQRGHTMALRGSAGNCLTCYLLHITDVDPVRFRLGFDRFLYPGRPDLPDIDLDFDWKVRDEVIAHVFARYGDAHTAMISSHLFLQPRSAFREAAKVHGLSNQQIARLIEGLGERVEGFAGEQDSPGRIPLPRLYPYPEGHWRRVLEDTALLLGRPHHLSVHPGGVVIVPGNIEDHVALQRAAKGVVITQPDKDGVEALGLVKIDLLGNRALGTVDEARRLLGRKPSEPIAPPPADGKEDAAVLDLLRRGDTLGVNQLESPAMRHLLVQLQPESVDDVILSLALIRPGAASGNVKASFLKRRRGLEPFEVPDILQPVLGEQQGTMVYEDDAIRVLEALLGWPNPEIHRFYKRLKKCADEAEDQQLAGEFLQRCAERRVPAATAAEQFALLTKYRHYSFCKSHAVSYGLIAWQALKLKAEEPAAFWAAALNNNQGMYPRRVYMEAVRRAGIEVRLPCINRSQLGFCLEEGALRVGLDSVATLSQEVKDRILSQRRRRPFADLADFHRRVQPGPEALACLLRVGACDFTGLNRPTLFLEAELLDRAEEDQPEQEPLFPGGEGNPQEGWQPDDYEARQRLLDEWNLLGFTVGTALLHLFEGQLPRRRVPAADIPTCVGKRVVVAGLVATSRHTTTHDGRPMQFLTLEDETGLVDLNLFPGNCSPLAHLTMGPYIARGTVEDDLGVYAINAEEVRRLE